MSDDPQYDPELDAMAKALYETTDTDGVPWDDLPDDAPPSYVQKYDFRCDAETARGALDAYRVGQWKNAGALIESQATEIARLRRELWESRRSEDVGVEAKRTAGSDRPGSDGGCGVTPGGSQAPVEKLVSTPATSAAVAVDPQPVPGDRYLTQGAKERLAAAVDPSPPEPDPPRLIDDCTECGAVAGYPCRSYVTGNEVSYLHDGRGWMAAVGQPVEPPDLCHHGVEWGECCNVEPSGQPEVGIAYEPRACARCGHPYNWHTKLVPADPAAPFPCHGAESRCACPDYVIPAVQEEPNAWQDFDDWLSDHTLDLAQDYANGYDLVDAIRAEVAKHLPAALGEEPTPRAGGSLKDTQ